MTESQGSDIPSRGKKKITKKTAKKATKKVAKKTTHKKATRKTTRKTGQRQAPPAEMEDPIVEIPLLANCPFSTSSLHRDRGV